MKKKKNYFQWIFFFLFTSNSFNSSSFLDNKGLLSILEGLLEKIYSYFKFSSIFGRLR
jgi:hypothetical protein